MNTPSGHGRGGGTRLGRSETWTTTICAIVTSGHQSLGYAPNA
jgi:hypothetical protein